MASFLVAMLPPAWKLASLSRCLHRTNNQSLFLRLLLELGLPIDNCFVLFVIHEGPQTSPMSFLDNLLDSELLGEFDRFLLHWIDPRLLPWWLFLDILLKQDTPDYFVCYFGLLCWLINVAEWANTTGTNDNRNSILSDIATTGIILTFVH